jgi:hypothetical protein
VSGERQLAPWREDPQARVAAALGRAHEDGFGEVELASELRPQFVGDRCPGAEYGEWVAGERPVREDVAEDVAEP